MTRTVRFGARVPQSTNPIHTLFTRVYFVGNRVPTPSMTQAVMFGTRVPQSTHPTYSRGVFHGMYIVWIPGYVHEYDLDYQGWYPRTWYHVVYAFPTNKHTLELVAVRAVFIPTPTLLERGTHYWNSCRKSHVDWRFSANPEQLLLSRLWCGMDVEPFYHCTMVVS